MDDPFIQCPYNKAHLVPRSRIQGHIIKCEKRYPELKICPHNATHRYKEDEIKKHVKNCPSKQPSWPEQRVPKPLLGLNTPMAPVPVLPDKEEWDD